MPFTSASPFLENPCLFLGFGFTSRTPDVELLLVLADYRYWEEANRDIVIGNQA